MSKADAMPQCAVRGLKASDLVLRLCGEIIDFNNMARVRELLKQAKLERERSSKKGSTTNHMRNET